MTAEKKENLQGTLSLGAGSCDSEEVALEATTESETNTTGGRVNPAEETVSNGMSYPRMIQWLEFQTGEIHRGDGGFGLVAIVIGAVVLLAVGLAR